MYYILIDEVQYAITKDEMRDPESIRLYNVLNGLMRLRNVDIYVTGSNSKMLTKDILTVFRGRGDEVRVCPSRNTTDTAERTDMRRMRIMPCMEACLWSGSKRGMRINWLTSRAFSQRCTSRISLRDMTSGFQMCFRN